jgi:hypothetical protein
MAPAPLRAFGTAVDMSDPHHRFFLQSLSLLKNPAEAFPETFREEQKPYFTPKTWSNLGTETVTRTCIGT